MKRITVIVFIGLIFSINFGLSDKWTRVRRYSHDCHVFKFFQVADSCIYALDQYQHTYLIILKSNDRGITWDTVLQETGLYPGFPTTYYDAAAISEDNILIGAAYGQIKKITDNCQNISLIYPNSVHTTSTNMIKNIEMYDSNFGVATSVNPSFLYKTEDGGESWQKLQPPTTAAIWEMKILQDKTILTLAYDTSPEKSSQSCFLSKDCGETWTKHKIRDGIGETSFFNDKIGWGCGGWPNGVGDQSSDIIMKTTDGGKTWIEIYNQENEPVFGLQDIDFYDENFGVAVGQFGKILRTTDGGDSWVQDSADFDIQDGPPVMTVLCTGPNRALCGGWGGEIFLYDGSTDGVEDSAEQLTKLNLFPNPVKSGAKLNFELSQVLAGQAQIFNLQGMLIDSLYFVGNSIYLPNDIAVGTYFLVIESNGEIIAREKFVVE